jgi:branched-chain amino acid transport system ATP-binding protein
MTATEKATEKAGESILAVSNVTKRFGGLRAVDRANFGVAQGSITALIGPNGAGKTTLLDLISGYDRPDLGAVRFEGRRIDGLGSHRVARRGVVRTFQLTRVFAAMSVLDNMMLGAQRHPGEDLRRLAFSRAVVRRAEATAREHAERLLRTFALDAKASEYAGALSGGQRKLLEFARALMAEPRLVLLDEPMAGVNRALGAKLLDEVERLRREEGMTFLFIEHDIDIVMQRADRVVVMAEGKVVAEGPPELIRRDQRVIDAYLGRRGNAA